MSPAPTLSEWHGSDTSANEVAGRLGKLHREHAQGEGGHATTRTLTLIVVPAPDFPESVDDRLALLGDAQPARTIVLGQHEAQALEAEVRLTCAGSGFCRDAAYLTAGTDMLAHAPSLLAPLLVDGLPLVAWLPGGGLERLNRSLASWVDIVVLDSNEGEDRAGLERARDLAVHARLLHDLAWGRTARWRSRIATAFEPADRRAMLPRIDSIEVRVHRDRIGALLLAGWIVARTGHAPDALRVDVFAGESDEGQGEVVFRAADEEVRVHRDAAQGRSVQAFATALSPEVGFGRGYASALETALALPVAGDG